MVTDAQLLRQTWKRYKVGLVRWEDIDQKTQDLLKRYYPIKEADECGGAEEGVRDSTASEK